MNRHNAKIAICILLSLLLVNGLKVMFVGASPVINELYIKAVPSNTVAFLSSLIPKPKPTQIITQIQTGQLSPFPTVADDGVIPTAVNNPSVQPTVIVPTFVGPTEVIPTTGPGTPRPTRVRPTRTPTPRPSRAPTPSPSTSCPTTSSNSYTSVPAGGGAIKLGSNLENHPEVNIHLRGFGENSETKGLISRNGNNYGLDDKKPPQISTLLGGEVPSITKTYDIYEWDFENHRSLKPSRATPNYKVHMIGLGISQGKQLRGLQAGRDIGGGNVFMLLYATKNDILFTHARADNLEDGYLFYFTDICVDPNLLAAYERDRDGGRAQLPVIAPGQVFGTASAKDTKITIRDTWSFVDPRYKEDWWFYGQ